jgi:multisubunit Na+/H+ antiporter MnhC subunit
VLTWSRFTLYIGDFLPRAKELSNTLATAFLDMQHLLLILLLVFCGFALGFQQAFGDFIVQFSSLYSTCFHLFKALTGDMEGMSEIPKSNRYLGPVLYFMYLIVIFFVLLNMVLGVVVRSYEKIERRCETRAQRLSPLLSRCSFDVFRPGFGKRLPVQSV